MTFDECQNTLTSIRRRQGTRCPIVRVDHGGYVFQGRLARADSDPEYQAMIKPPTGLLVLEEMSADRRPEVMLQIAELIRGAIHDGRA